MADYTNEELFAIIKSTIIKSNLGSKYISKSKTELIERIAISNAELYELAVKSAMEEIKKIKSQKLISKSQKGKSFKIFAEKLQKEQNISNIYNDKPEYEFIYSLNGNASIFSLIVSGESMINAGINNGDLLIAESDTELKTGDIVIVEVNDEIYVKRLKIDGNEIWLFSENQNYEPVKITSDVKFRFKGKVKAGLKFY